MAAENPIFFLGNSVELTGFTFPMADVTAGTLSFGTLVPQDTVPYGVRPLLQRIAGNIPTDTTTRTVSITMSLVMPDGSQQGDILQAAAQLRDSIGYDANHLWFVDDSGSVQGLLTSGGTAGPGNVTVSYSTADATGVALR